ncbi:hypothetical protein POVCU2_0048770 [Plasmodium ovale curtisi]|uniref:Uncharacterized protein n=1 Tax=Plasmodium ovale curtisi TaxID=864141 RepID=A0A1A8WBA2_PLAOA|nr:hypothetical protein POVCU2_0048770 [Plasmodium ovale curtisi]SBT02845.1 hypothetical protein POVCU1_081400 [Plasmodium ovale curtisi]
MPLNVVIPPGIFFNIKCYIPEHDFYEFLLLLYNCYFCKNKPYDNLMQNLATERPLDDSYLQQKRDIRRRTGRNTRFVFSRHSPWSYFQGDRSNIYSYICAHFDIPNCKERRNKHSLRATNDCNDLDDIDNDVDSANKF